MHRPKAGWLCLMGSLVLACGQARTEELILIGQDYRIALNCEQGVVQSLHLTALPEALQFTPPRLPRHCRPSTALPYGKIHPGYRQGMELPRTLPQAPMSTALADGHWRQTRTIRRCLARNGDVQSMAGVIWGYTETDDYFEHSHGVETPDAFWLLLVTDEGRVGWVLPNDPAVNRRSLSAYRTDPNTLEGVSFQRLPPAVIALPPLPQATPCLHNDDH